MQLTVKLPWEVRAALLTVQKVYPGAFVAGGAVRDTLFGRPIKDIDVFVGEDFDLGKLQAEDKVYEYEPEFGEEFVDRYGKHFGRLVREVIKGTQKCDLPIVKRPPVQIIRRRGSPTIAETLDTFDFGFCQIGVGHLDSLHRELPVVATKAFFKDYAHRTATLMLEPGDSRMEGALARAERLAAKYPDVMFVQPLPKLETKQ